MHLEQNGIVRMVSRLNGGQQVSLRLFQFLQGLVDSIVRVPALLLGAHRLPPRISSLLIKGLARPALIGAIGGKC